MSIAAQNFVANLRARTVGEKSVLFALARAHHHRTGVCQISLAEIARTASVSKRYAIDLLRALEQRDVIVRKSRGKSAAWASKFEFVNFNFSPAGTGEPASPEPVNSLHKTGELASPAYKEEGKTRSTAENQIPPTPLLQRGDVDIPPPRRRRLTSRDIRNLVKKIDSMYEAAVGATIEFKEAFEAACGKCFIHPDDARQAIGITPEFEWDKKRPPERAVS